MPPVVLLRDNEVVEREVDQAQLTPRYTAESIKFIRESAQTGKPFFLYLAHAMPHVPLHVDESHMGKSARGLYGDVIEALDDSTGQILDAIKQLNIDDNTLVIFTSDNGPWHARGEEGGSAFPFRAGKGTAYEGGMRVPCVMRWPGTIPAGKVCTELAVTFDFLPTFAAIAGGEVPQDRIIDGKDISPLMFGAPGARSPHESFYYYGDRRLNAVRMGNWKLKLETTLQEETLYGKYQDPESLIPEALYNLTNDPGEQKSVLKDHPKIVEKLHAIADQARQDLGDRRLSITGKNVRPVGRLPEGASTRPVSEMRKPGH
jgi:arylsulfatase A-like enzyme